MFIFGSRDSMSSTRQGSTNRRNRYTRSSTTSVTQLLSDSCSSLLQRLTTRVRGPSSTADRSTIRRSPIANNLGLTRSRLEDKYSSILDRYTGSKKRDDDQRDSVWTKRPNNEERDHSYCRRDGSPFVRDDKTLEPSVPRSTAKSASSVLLSEKAYPYVSSVTGRELRRDKTPGYHGRIDRQTLVNSEAYKRYGRHKSGHAETKNRKVRPANRSGKSEQLDDPSLVGSRYRSRPMESRPSPDFPKKSVIPDPDKTPTIGNDTEPGTIADSANDEAISEREAKRKEIQTLIMKYAAIDEAYGNASANGGEQKPSAADIIASKYQRNAGAAKVSKTRAEPKTVDAITSPIVSCRENASSGVLVCFHQPLVDR